MIKNKAYNYLTIGYLLFSPLMALPFILYGIYHRYKNSFFFLSVFLGVSAYLMPPTGDLYRHTLEYNMFKFYTLNDLYDYVGTEDFLTQYLSFVLAKNGIPYPFLRFFITIVSYNILFYIFNFYVEKHKSFYTKKEIFIRFFFLIITSDFFVLVWGVRYIFAVCTFVLAYHYFYIEKKRIGGITCLLLAICIHHGLLYYSIAMIVLIKYLNIKRQYIWLLAFTAFVIGYFGYYAIVIIASKFDSSYFHIYMGTGRWGVINIEISESTKLTHFIDFIYERLSLISSCVLVLNFNYDRRERYCKFLYAIILFYCLTNRFSQVSGRILFIGEHLLLFFIFFSELHIGKKIDKKVFIFVFLVLSARFMIKAIGFGNILYLCSEYEKISYPITEIFKVDYDYNWMVKNINSDGSLIR